MPSALIIGGRGQSGRAICGRLLEAGWTVTATTSGPLPSAEATPGVTWVGLVRDEAGDIGTLVGGEHDVVVDAVCFSAAHARQLVALGDRVASAVVISTISVYTDERGHSLDGSVSESDFPAWPDPIPPGWPTLAPGEGYSAGKAWVEQVLREEAPWPVTVVRPGAIHGEGSHHLREWYFIKRALDGRRQVVLPFRGDKVFQPTATANLAELVKLAAERPGSRTLDCGDMDPPSASGISEVIDGLMGRSTERIVLDGPEPAENVGNHPWAVPRSVRVDMTPAVDELGYRQAKSYAEAMADTVPWAIQATKERPWREVFSTLASYPGDLFDYGAEDAYLSGR